MRIGVVADTHVGDELPRLPPEVCDTLDRVGVDLILHAGDLCEPGVLDDLAAVAPVVAVRGNHDPAGLGLPEHATVPAGGHRIGLTHGVRRSAVEMASAAAFLATGRLRMTGHCRALRRAFPAVDAVVFGHLHLPACRVVEGVLYFSPGSVYQPELDPAFAWTGLERRIYRRVRRRMRPEQRRSAIGVIDAGERLIARIVPLRGPIHPRGPRPEAS